MWKDVNLEHLTEAENAYSPLRPPEEVEQVVVMARLALSNRGAPFGTRTLQRLLNEFYHLKPLPSMHMIERILAHNGLIERR